MKECDYCHWSNTDLRTITVLGEPRLICGGCVQSMANEISRGDVVSLLKRFEGVEERLNKLEAMLIP